MIVKKGEVITLASGIFESYNREGPFVALQDFDLDAFVAEMVCIGISPLEVDDLLESIPGMLIDRGFLALLPCQMIHLGSMGQIDVRVEKRDS